MCVACPTLLPSYPLTDTDARISTLLNPITWFQMASGPWTVYCGMEKSTSSVHISLLGGWYALP